MSLSTTLRLATNSPTTFTVTIFEGTVSSLEESIWASVKNGIDTTEPT